MEDILIFIIPTSQKMHEHYEKDGYTVISKNPTRDINAKGHKGIDGVYYKKDGHPPFIIGEAKYGKQLFTYSKSGKITISIL